MIIEDKQDTFNDNVNIDYDYVKNDISNVKVSRDTLRDFPIYLQTRHVMHTKGIHEQLQTDLVKHSWEHYNHNNNEI